ncbi:Uncharacterized protein Adt_33431 [Abeliophyllum distichum]|uniref:Transposase MuDR plant domain-containing protein n=1 Tax=Abeliophyllum distichum TaxID=126358 RepID=A0ABD1QW84_9LAMI
MDINADDQNVESPAGNSKNTASSYSSGHEVVNDNQFTNEQLLTLSSPITTHVIPTDEDVPDDKVFKSKKDLMMESHLLAMKYDFEFRVKKSNKQTYTIVCFDQNCKWRLQATKFAECDYFKVRKYKHEHTCSLSIRGNDHRQTRSWLSKDI